MKKKIKIKCTRCGPSLSGRCYGPNICCSPLTGCNVGGFTAARCSLEAYHPILCTNPGAVCGPNGKGVCALNATCCTNGKYFICFFLLQKKNFNYTILNSIIILYIDGCFIDKSCTQLSNDSNDL